MVIKFDFRYKKFDGDLLLTTACPVECDFCVYSCMASRDPSKWMPEKTIRRVAEEYTKNDIGIRVAGGEPFYDLEKLEKCIDILLEYYKPFEILVITSGFFGVNKKNAEKFIDVINRKCLNTLVVSIDRFHLRNVPLKNVENIVEVCNKFDIEVPLRITLDSLSFNLIDKISKIVVKNKLPIEVHNWGIVGRAEKIDSSPLKNEKNVKEYIFSKIKEFALKCDAPTNPKYYLTHTPKRSQREYGGEFFPTTFPNGNVYACSMTMKGCFMGNINEENLSDMILRFKNNLPGYYVLSNFNCMRMVNFLPKKTQWICDLCKDKFSIKIKKIPEEALGREFIKIDSNSGLNKLFKQLLEKKNSITEKEYERELLISFILTEKDLNKNAGKKIKNFLDKLRENKIRFVLSRPLPPCLGRITDDRQPKNCFECKELFTVESNFIRYCESLERMKGCRIEEIKNREEMYKHFKIAHNKLKAPKACEGCLFMIRNQCNGMCFVK